MAAEKKEPCKKEACNIQACLTKNNFNPQRLTRVWLRTSNPALPCLMCEACLRCLHVIELLQTCCEKCEYKSTHCASLSGLLKMSNKSKKPTPERKA